MASKKKIAAAMTAGVLAAAMTMGGSYAYLSQQTESVDNEFKPNKISVELNETTGETYDIIPGAVQDKDPVITVENTVLAVLYVQIDDNTKGMADFDLNLDGWTLVPSKTNVYSRTVQAGEYITNDNGEKVWVRKGTTTPLQNEFHLLKNDKVSYKSDLTNDDMLDNRVPKDNIKLSFKSWAYQLDGFTTPSGGYNPLVVHINMNTLRRVEERDPRLIMDVDPMNVMTSNNAETKHFPYYFWDNNRSRYVNRGQNLVRGVFGEDIPIEDKDINKYFTVSYEQELDMNGHSLICKRTDDVDVYGGFRVNNFNMKPVNTLIHNGNILAGNTGICVETNNVTDTVTVKNVNIFSNGPCILINRKATVIVESGYFYDFGDSDDNEHPEYFTLNIYDPYMIHMMMFQNIRSRAVHTLITILPIHIRKIPRRIL